MLLSQFGTIQLFHIQFSLWLLDLHTGFLGDRYGSLVFLSLEDISTVYCDPHKGFCIVNEAEVDFYFGISLLSP